MASINIGETDYEAVAVAAHQAFHGGQIDQARALDKLARKINLALSANAVPREMRFLSGSGPKLTWRDMPPTVAGLDQ